MISRTGQVPYSSAADHNNAVLLQVVSLSGDVACYLNSVGMEAGIGMVTEDRLTSGGIATMSVRGNSTLPSLSLIHI